MSQNLVSKTKNKLPHLGLVMQLFTIILLPLTILLVVITFGSIAVHEKAMRTLVGERDERLVSVGGRALSAQVDLRVKELTGLAQLYSSEANKQFSSVSPNASYFLGDFDNGLAIFASDGKLLMREGDPQLWEAWTKDPTIWQSVFSELSFNPGKLNVVKSPVDGAYMGLISAPTGGNLMIVGALEINNLVERTLVNILPPSSQLSIILVDANRNVLYKWGDAGDYSSNHPGIAEALQGNSGAVFVKVSGDEHVTAYSPVSSAGWALITEESWQSVVTPTLQTSQVAPLALVPALLIMALALWLGTRQIVQPLRKLESEAATLASGDFNTIQEPVGGIAEIQHLQTELVAMANKVQEAQRSLHGYIGAITAAQEDERQRLARELHDDTLQALIALKQRVQLAQLELQSATGNAIPESTEIQELGSLTEQTIENLRRLTRALRPIYLEDLGLVPALEMLARETGQAMGITVEFQRLGTEKRLDPASELALYRMAQEALSNISRHAQAKIASMIISFTENEVTLLVRDNGIGFKLPVNTAEYAINGHYGLLGLHERAELIGASLNIRSSPGKGTEVTIKLPMKPTDGNNK
ncbi:MAG TPA: ATP-binding protein [Anaerolineales bacterium]